MLQQMFEKLCIKLRPSIQENKRFRDRVSLEKQVAAALYYLADEGRVRKVANFFGIEKWTISKIIRRVLFLLQKNLPLYLLNKSNITISQTENHTELAYLLNTNGNTKCYIILYVEFCFHYIEQFLQRCKNLSNIMETWYKTQTQEIRNYQKNIKFGWTHSLVLTLPSRT